MDNAGTAAALQAFVGDSKTPGLQYVAVDRSSTLIECHVGLADVAARRPMTSDETLMAYSMSKTITAAAVLQLVEAGRVGLDDPVARFVEWQPYGEAITVRQLLSHTSGTPNPIPLRWVHAARDHDRFDERAALDEVLRANPRVAFRPGTKYAYSNIGYWLLGFIVERAGGQPFTSYVTTHVLDRLGISRNQIGYAVADPACHAAGYLEKYSFTNLFKRLLIDKALIGDYEGPWLRIRDHYLNGPAFGGLVGTAVSFSRFLQDQLRAHSALFGDATRALFYEQQHVSGRPIAMTLGWHMGSTGGMAFYFKEGGGGGFHCLMRLYPAQGIGTVIMSNATAFPVHEALSAVDPILLTASARSSS